MNVLLPLEKKSLFQLYMPNKSAECKWSDANKEGKFIQKNNPGNTSKELKTKAQESFWIWLLDYGVTVRRLE